MLDVDEYLKQLQNSEHLDKVNENPYLKNSNSQMENKHEEESDIISVSESIRNKSYSNQLNNQARIGSSASTKRPGVYGKGKKSIKNFMKNQLQKTKQSGKDAIFTVCKLNFNNYFIASSSVYQKPRIPKKKNNNSANQLVNKRKNSNLRRNDSSTRAKRPPLKPNLKGSKAILKRTTNINRENSGSSRKSININPFKPPRPRMQQKDSSKINSQSKIWNETNVIEPSNEIEKSKEENKYNSDKEIQSDYGIVESSEENKQSIFDKTIKTGK